MDMRCFISLVTTMITSLISTATTVSDSNRLHTLETSSMDFTFRKNSLSPSIAPHYSDNSDVTCCNGVLGFASDNMSLNYPCQLRPCCNQSHTQAVVPIEFALGFRFQCMPRSAIQTMCYSSGSEVRTSNHDPDFIPRACCPGLRFHVELHNWYAALVIRCVGMEDNDS